MIRTVGEHSLLIELPLGVHPADAADALRSNWHGELTDVAPGHDTVLATWAGAPPSFDDVLSAVANLTEAATVGEPNEITIPVVYNGPDLEAVATAIGMSVEGVIDRHTQTDYRAAFLGFLPGFAYLVCDEPSLQVPRQPDPRPSIPAGSVALGGEYCAVYPRPSPGGWQLIGTTDATLFDPNRDPPALIECGSHVHFEAVRK